MIFSTASFISCISGLHRIHVNNENHKLQREKELFGLKRNEKKVENVATEMHHNLRENVLFHGEHYVNFARSLLLFVSQQCLIKNVTNMELRRRSESEEKSAIIYDDGVVVMQKEWLQTINFHMQYILFTSHNVSL